MDDARFKNIIGNLTESVTVPLNYVRRFLLENKATVMVGAGFSKNAIMDEQTSMKDWSALGQEFYKKIHGHDVSKDDVRFLSITRLAQQVEAVFHRNELEQCIKQSLPDELIEPGDLHTMLMSLNWHDVFTTNYDTLLERAAKKAGKNYTVVTNKETLLYQSSPRIIKLHGSFPNITPFIITEEDFRKYPKLFPEFVNTVRQSLIENVFCLIGFSGDDPNFLSWEGWLRDIMGSRVSSVYMIDWRENVPMAELELMRQRNISLINLALCEDLKSRQEAFEFVFKYLKGDGVGKQEKTTPIYYEFFSNNQDPDKVIQTFSEARNEFNKWLLLPRDKWKGFEDERKNDVFFSQSVEKWTNEQKLDFIYELDCRKDIALVPKSKDLYESTLELFKDPKVARPDAMRRKISALKISLMGILREHGCDNDLNMLKEELVIEDKSLWDGLMIDKFHYICCLWEIEHCNIDKAKEDLELWNVSVSNYRGVLWKSSILNELGMNAEAIELLRDSSSWIKNRMLNTDSDKSLLQSYRNLIDNQIDRFTPDSFPKDADVVQIFKLFWEKIKKKDQHQELTPQGNKIKYEHGFGVDDITTHIHLSGRSNTIDDFLYEYRLIKLFEWVGIPMTYIYQEAFESLDSLPKLFLLYYIKLSLRSKKKRVIEKVLNRDNLSKLDADSIRILIDNIFNELEKTQDKSSRNIRLEALSYLMVKSNKAQREKYFEKIVNLFCEDDEAYSRNYLKVLYDNMSEDEIKRVVLPQIFSRPLKVRKRKGSIELPGLYATTLAGIQLSDEAVKNIVDSLSDKDPKVVDLAIAYTYYAYLTDLSPEKKEELRSVIGKIRKDNPTLNTYLYNDIPYEEKYDVDINEVRETIVGKFLEYKYEIGGSSDYIRDYCEMLSDISDIGIYLRKEDVASVSTKVTDFLLANKDIFIKNFNKKYAPVFDMHDKVDRIMSCMTRLLGNTPKDVRNEVDKEVLGRLYDAVCLYDQYNIATLPLKVRINIAIRLVKDVELRESAFKDILSREDNVREGSSFAIVLLAEMKVRIQNELTKIISKASNYKDASFYLRLLSILVKRNYINKTRFKDLVYVLECIYENTTDARISELEKIDAIHGACVLAGCCSMNKEMMTDAKFTSIVDKWRQYSEDENNFNDVRFGFVQGVKSLF